MKRESNSEQSRNSEIIELTALTYGATPFIHTPEQADVYDNLLARIERSMPDDTPGAIKVYLYHHFMARFHQRQDRNSNSYQRRLVQDLTQLDPEMKMLHDKAFLGRATPDELLTAFKALGMPSVELGRVTHPNGVHLDALDELRHATKDAIVNRGGHVFEPHEYETYELEDADVGGTAQGKVGQGFLMVRKRIIGVLPDGTEVTERSSFVVRIDEASGFDQKLAARMREVHILDNKYWQEDLINFGELLRSVPPFLDNDDFKTAIPLSSTIFANNPVVEKEVEMREQIERRASHIGLSKESMVIIEQQRALHQRADLVRRHFADIDDEDDDEY